MNKNLKYRELEYQQSTNFMLTNSSGTTIIYISLEKLIC